MRPDRPTDPPTTPRWWASGRAASRQPTADTAHEQTYSLLVPTRSGASFDATLSDRLELLFTPDESPSLTRGFSLPLDAGRSRSPVTACSPHPPHLLRPMRSLDVHSLPRMTEEGEEEEGSDDAAPAEAFCERLASPPSSAPSYPPTKTLTVGRLSARIGPCYTMVLGGLTLHASSTRSASRDRA